MTIAARSRYAQGDLVWVDHPVQGRVQVVHLAPPIWSNYPYVEYEPTSADTLDALAHRQYGAPQDWWFIAEMNPTIEHPDRVQSVETLRIPTARTV